MRIFEQIEPLKTTLSAGRKTGLSIGFVPTMGALHEGHVSLVNRARQENDIVVVSIFVNPTQFNNPEDLKNYPVSPETDQAMLIAAGVDYLFAPNVDVVYDGSAESKRKLDPGPVADVMEGKHRPGHFAGVIQVVARLFEIVEPDNAYFGEKDFQQLAVVRKMTESFGLPVNIIGCPTVREENGLAMSSRNLRLTGEERQLASTIYKSFALAKDTWKSSTPDALKKTVRDKIEFEEKLKVEYIEIADEESLQPLKNWSDAKHARILGAVYCGNVRLIDNLRLY